MGFSFLILFTLKSGRCCKSSFSPSYALIASPGGDSAPHQNVAKHILSSKLFGRLIYLSRRCKSRCVTTWLSRLLEPTLVNQQFPVQPKGCKFFRIRGSLYTCGLDIQKMIQSFLPDPLQCTCPILQCKRLSYCVQVWRSAMRRFCWIWWIWSFQIPWSWLDFIRICRTTSHLDLLLAEWLQTEISNFFRH